jgi:hypothetical protein
VVTHWLQLYLFFISKIARNYSWKAKQQVEARVLPISSFAFIARSGNKLLNSRMHWVAEHAWPEWGKLEWIHMHAESCLHGSHGYVVGIKWKRNGGAFLGGEGPR